MVESTNKILWLAKKKTRVSLVTCLGLTRLLVDRIVNEPLLGIVLKGRVRPSGPTRGLSLIRAFRGPILKALIYIYIYSEREIMVLREAQKLPCFTSVSRI
jgi:hypothetical protein